MVNIQSKIDLLEDQNFKLVTEINELRKKCVKAEAENVKLRQIIEKSIEFKIRFEELEKKNKTDIVKFTAKNTELKNRVTKLEQKRSETCLELPINP
ncbi:hypothetical protein Glove_120g42 [Diversispora epigaea]|uniref:Uncharacterized protein n=1 Tax=Diversispora epigaea TaxID=1348612 RepID=A0A397J3B6_9GLOM|nr:hypothetical protein Glove_120g42 [Diversispora epigaea]